MATRLSYNVYSWLYHHDVPATVRTRESFFAFVKSIPILKDKIKALVDENKVAAAQSSPDNSKDRTGLCRSPA